MRLFTFDRVDFRYDPFPIARARNVLPPDLYAEMVRSWPPTDQFRFMQVLGDKYSLSQLNHPGKYHRYVADHDCWRRFHRYIKGRDFVHQMMETLFDRHVDLGLGGKQLAARRAGPLPLVERLKLWVKSRKVSARFEFSMLPADGGHLKPHTDDPRKVVSLVVPILAENEWKPEYGGGTAILKPKDITRNYNFMNRQMDFEEFEILESLPFEPNQAIVFIKTFNSFHAVYPIRGPQGALRKSLTINLEVR